MKVIKTTFKDEQKAKEEAWLMLSGEERLDIAYQIINAIKAPLTNYSLKGKKVKIIRFP